MNILGFGKNNEYSNSTVPGYTLFGYQFNPYLAFSVSPHLRLDIGVYLQQDFGNSRYSQISPTFSIKYQKRNHAFIFGTLEGSLNHRLIEPLYDFERVLNDRIENGVQYLLSKEGFFLDTWVNWQKMIYWNDPQQELFTAGLSLVKSVYKKNTFGIEIPFYLIAQHRGGEIDQSTGRVSTLYNGAVGINILGSGSGHLKNWGMKSSYVFYKDGSLNPQQLFNDGYGLYVNPYVTTDYGLTLMATYWYADEFISPLGGLIYTAYKEHSNIIAESNRSLFMLRLLYDVNLGGAATMTLRAEPFYDTFANAMQYSFGLYLNYYDRFYLLNVKKDH